MIFEALYGSVQRGELLLTEGGYCRWHLRRDKRVTILEIISTRRGTGKYMLARVLGEAQARGANEAVARCPADLPANDWWQRRGFLLERTEQTKSGRKINVWVRQLSSTARPAIPLSVVSPVTPAG